MKFLSENNAKKQSMNWVFLRDDFDLLVDAYDDVFDQHDQTEDLRLYELEEMLIEEQMTTEEETENDLKKLGIQWLEADLEQEPREGILKSPVFRRKDALYHDLREWAQELYAWAKEAYSEKGIHQSDVYRIYLNVALVPIKYAFACEELSEQKEKTIALKELELSQTYLLRIRHSLEQLLQADLLQKETDYLKRTDYLLLKLRHVIQSKKGGF